jgi:hypothetical protein
MHFSINDRLQRGCHTGACELQATNLLQLPDEHAAIKHDANLNDAARIGADAGARSVGGSQCQGRCFACIAAASLCGSSGICGCSDVYCCC